jgi:hypothetical protein
MFIKRFGPVYSFWMYPYERFNSWISRRVLNRRYPESTVVQTYLLSEWANFMEAAGELAEGATDALDQENEIPLHAEETLDYDLTDDQYDQLKAYYISVVPEYEQLIEQYECERECARASRCLRSFPSFSMWQPQCLSEEQRCLQSGPVRFAIRVKYYIYLDSHRRRIKLSTMESDQEYMYCRCSYISAQIDGVLMFGRILTIFRHTFLSTVTTFAYVSWFENSIVDKGTDLK